MKTKGLPSDLDKVEYWNVTMKWFAEWETCVEDVFGRNSGKSVHKGYLEKIALRNSTVFQTFGFKQQRI